METTNAATRILLAYTTNTGTTRRMAEAVAEGIESVEGAEADIRELSDGTEVEMEEVASADGIILGTPMRHRNMHHAVKRFVEETLEVLWMGDATIGMVGGVFTVGGGHGDMGAGCEMAQVGMLSAMAANGMVLVPLPKTTPGFDHAGCHWGPAGRTGGPKMQPLFLTEAMARAGFHHGANVARVAQALQPHRGRLFARGNQSPPEEILEAFQGGENPYEGNPPPEGANPMHRQEAPEGFPSTAGFPAGDGQEETA